MKPAPFAYRAAESMDEALALLGEHGSEAAVLAGGQSLLIDLRYRTARPAVVVDINRVAGLDRIGGTAEIDWTAGANWAAGTDGTSGTDVADGPGARRTGGERAGGWVRIGPLVRHARFAAAPGRPAAAVDGPLGALMAQMAPWIAHPPIRARGTFAGSIAWGHPCAEWGALTAGLGGLIEVRGATGRRVVPAAEWFVGPCRTARRADEIVTAVHLPSLPAGTGTGFAEHRRSSASFALAAAVATVTLAGDRVGEAHIGLAGAGPVPWRAAEAERALAGQVPTEESVDAAARAAAAGADPAGEAHASILYRRHVVAELVRRAVRDAVRSAEEHR